MKNKWFKMVLTAICVLVAGVCYVSGCKDPAADVIIFETVSSEAGTDADGAEAGGEQPVEAEVPEQQKPREDSGEGAAEAAGNSAQTDHVLLESGAEEKKAIYVHICGEVVTPGVYELMDGSRIFEAVKMAGGYTEQAAVDFLNMAQPLEDGMKITVPDQKTASDIIKAEKENPEDIAARGISSVTVPSAGIQSSRVQTEKNMEQPVPAELVNINTAQKDELMTLRGIGEAKADDIISYRQQNGSFKKIEDIMNVSGIKEAAFQKIRDNITV